jgi:hypothetical protein
VTVSVSRKTLRKTALSISPTDIRVCLNYWKFRIGCELYLKLGWIRMKMAEFEERATVWPELAEIVLKDTLSCARRRLGMSRGHKLTLGTNMRDTRLARRRRHRLTLSGGLKLQVADIATYRLLAVLETLSEASGWTTLLVPRVRLLFLNSVLRLFCPIDIENCRRALFFCLVENYSINYPILCGNRSDPLCAVADLFHS